MNDFAVRKNGSPQCSTNSRLRDGLETTETVLTAPRFARFAGSRTRAALTALFCLALGSVTLVSHAQDAAKPADPVPAQTPPTKPAETAAPAPQTPPPAVPAAPSPVPGAVTFSGLVDIYFGINARAPRSLSNGAFTGTVTPSGETINIDNAFRAFDINDREPSFSLGEINISRTPNKSIPLGLTATLTVGDTARIVHATEPGGTSSWQTIQQLYATYTAKVAKRDVPIDFGIFVTPFGYEVIESSSNDNYSRSLNFTYGVPFYHNGIRIGFPLTPKLNLLAGVVNGWNDIADSNNAKSEFIQATWTPSPKFTGILGYMGGSEGTGAYGTAITGSQIPINDGNITTNLFEAEATLNLTPKLKIAGDLVYGDGSGDITGVHYSGHWLGFTGYLRYQISPKFAIAIRGEQFEDMGNVRFGSGLPYVKAQEGTITLEYAALRGHLISRLEYRHDHSSETTTFGAGSNGTTPDQDTFYVGEVYKF